jgi:2-amino-4-hydroxy-6-hydroxymethyldihydropteridine diphosphokinase
LKRVWLALGSNLGDREAHLRQAIDRLRSAAFQIQRISPVYETAPQGFSAQGWFLNLVLAAETSLPPLRLLAHCDRVERALKRRREIENGPRTIDVDVLFYAESVIRSARLEIPHPRYAARRFVVQPLADLDPDLRDPVSHRTVNEMLADVSHQAIRKTAITIEP